MSQLLSLFVYGDPKPQPRARVYVRNGQARAYTPALANEWKAAIVRAVRSSGASLGHPGPLRVSCQFYLPRPASHVGKSGVKASAPPWPVSPRADADNLAKAALDACTDAGLWLDDGQVVRLWISKHYAQTVGPTGMQLDVEAL